MQNFEVRITPISEEAKKEYEPVVAEVDSYVFSGCETGLKEDGEDVVAFHVSVAGNDIVLLGVYEILTSMREKKPNMVDNLLRRILNGEKLE